MTVVEQKRDHFVGWNKVGKPNKERRLGIREKEVVVGIPQGE